MIKDFFKRMFGVGRVPVFHQAPELPLFTPPVEKVTEFLPRRGTTTRTRASFQKASRRVNRGQVKRKKTA